MSNTSLRGQKNLQGVAPLRLTGYEPGIDTVQLLHWNQLLQFTCVAALF